jgi:hypothetical protein
MERGRTPRRRTRGPGGWTSLLVFVLLAVPLAPLAAYETDQYTGRLLPLADSTEILNALMNREIERVLADWRHGRNEKRLVREIFWHLGGLHWVDKVERWTIRSPLVEKLPTPKRASIYAGLPLYATRVITFVGVGATLRLNGSLVGSDKLGHFLSQGRKYHRHYLRTGDHGSVVRHGMRNERGFFGRATTGVYSNADLVANYEGYLFFRGLTEDGIVAGKPALLGWEGERPFLRRRFDWADHVNDFWDEALNPSRCAPSLQKHLRKNLLALCPDYFSAPEAYVSAHHDELQKRYAHLGMKEAQENRLDHVCEPSRDAAGEETDE